MSLFFWRYTANIKIRVMGSFLFCGCTKSVKSDIISRRLRFEFMYNCLSRSSPNVWIPTLLLFCWNKKKMFYYYYFFFTCAGYDDVCQIVLSLRGIPVIPSFLHTILTFVLFLLSPYVRIHLPVEYFVLFHSFQSISCYFSTLNPSIPRFLYRGSLSFYPIIR